MSPLLDVAIVGGGPGGLLAAKSILTARPDLRVAVFERSSNIRSPRGASLGLLPNGFRALEAVDPAFRERALALDARHTRKRICNPEGAVIFEAEGDVNAETRKFGDISHLAWHDLRSMLADTLPEGIIRTGLAFEQYEESGDGLEVTFRQLGQPEGQLETVGAKLLVGADGNQSGVRQQLFGDGPPSFMGTVIWRGVLPEAPSCWDSSVNSQLSWFGMKDGRAFSAFSLSGGRLSVLAVAPWPHEKLGELGDANYIQEPGKRLEQAQQSKQRCLDIFADWPEEVRQLLAAVDPMRLTEHGQFFRDPQACTEWGRGRVTLLGDAAHLATPFLAQGTSQAFEDGLELGRAIHELGATPEALRRYETVRQPLNAPVHTTSVELFRDFVQGKAKPGSELQANIEQGFMARTFEPLPRLQGAALSV